MNKELLQLLLVLSISLLILIVILIIKLSFVPTKDVKTGSETVVRSAVVVPIAIEIEEFNFEEKSQKEKSGEFIFIQG